MQGKGLFIRVLFVLIAKASLVQAQVQERTLVTAMGEDVGYRVRLIGQHLDDEERKRKLNTGQQLLTTLRGNPIRLWIHFSHGHHSRIFGKIPERKISYFSNGFIISPHVKSVGKSSATLEDLRREIAHGKIQFAPGSLIILGACAVAVPNEETGIVFAQELANVTGAKVIAGEHKTEPLRENEREMVFTNVKNFVQFRPYQTPVILGNQLDLPATVQEYLQTNFSKKNIVEKNTSAIPIKDEWSTERSIEYPIHNTQIPEQGEIASNGVRD